MDLLTRQLSVVKVNQRSSIPFWPEGLSERQKRDYGPFHCLPTCTTISKLFRFYLFIFVSLSDSGSKSVLKFEHELETHLPKSNRSQDDSSLNRDLTKSRGVWSMVLGTQQVGECRGSSHGHCVSVPFTTEENLQKSSDFLFLMPHCPELGHLTVLAAGPLQ